MFHIASFVTLYLLVLFNSVHAIISGERVQWNRNGYLVKIFSREPESNLVTSCSGSLISASLVLTAPLCILNSTTHQRFGEVAVTVATLRRPRTLRAEIVNVTDSWALLKIASLPVKDLCPPDPAPKRVAQLNVRVSLLRSSLITIDVSALSSRTCWITAFSTASDAQTFLYQDDVRMLELDTLKPSDDSVAGLLIYKAAIINNKTACWDDAGAALMCHLNEFGNVQVGIFQSLTLDDDGDGDGDESERDQNTRTTITSNPFKQCAKATSMNFALITNDQNLLSAIEKHDMPAFVDIYHKCRFDNT